MSRIVLVVGTGRCGLISLVGLLAKQPDTNVTVEDSPILPWKRSTDDHVIRDRLTRFLKRQAEVVVDAASFYLPYLAGAIAVDPDIRVIGLRRQNLQDAEPQCPELACFHLIGLRTLETSLMDDISQFIVHLEEAVGIRFSDEELGTFDSPKCSSIGEVVDFLAARLPRLAKRQGEGWTRDQIAEVVRLLMQVDFGIGDDEFCEDKRIVQDYGIDSWP